MRGVESGVVGMASDPTGAVSVGADLTVRVAADWRARLPAAGGDLGAAVVAAWALSSSGSSGVSAPACEGDAGAELRGVSGEVVCVVLLDVADRVSASLVPRVCCPDGPVTVTVAGGAVSAVSCEAAWLASATADEIGRAATRALRAAVPPPERASPAVATAATVPPAAVGSAVGSPCSALAEAGRLGADPVALFRALVSR